MYKIGWLIFVLFSTHKSKSQNVGIGTSNPHPSAKLEIQSTNSGFLPPRMTINQRNAINAPAQGLIIYCTDCGTIGEWQGFTGTQWVKMNGDWASSPPLSIDTTIPNVTIGSQIWSSKNLSVVRYRNGDPIPQVTDPTQWANLTTGAWCWYNNDSATYAATYGRLYNWYAINDPRGLAPRGWNVPSKSDWFKLISYLDPASDTTCSGCIQSQTAGGLIKTTSGWDAPNIGASNLIGFNGMPGGYRDVNISFNYIGSQAVWWTSSENGIYAEGAVVNNFSGRIRVYETNDKKHGFSVRVLRSL